MSQLDGVFGLYLSHGDEGIRLRDQNLVVEREGEKHKLPLACIESVVAGAKTRISGASAAELREREIAVSFLDWRGQLLARVEPHPSKNALSRRAQLAAAMCEERSMMIARWIVSAKLNNQRTFLLRAERKRQLGLQAAIQAIENAQHGAQHAGGREELMGYEGQGARAYFDAWPALLESTSFSWSGRSRRPPKDPVNAMLSLGYVVATSRCADAGAAVGLDPYVGFLHAEKYGRAELGLDLVEEFRTPWVDSLVLGLIGRRQVAPDDFEVHPNGACMLRTSARKVFFGAFSKMMNRTAKHPASGRQHPYAMFPVIQARLLAKYCNGELERYVPYMWR